MIEDILEATNDLASSPTERWSAIVQSPDFQSLDFESCENIWKKTFENWEKDDGPIPCWIPDASLASKTNLADWLDETSCQSAKQFHSWTVNNRSEFWDMAIEALQIAFREEPDSIFDDATGTESPALLPGARLNIAESCFLASGDQLAVITGRPDEDLEFHTYRQLHQTANRISNYLIEEGYQKGDRIAVIMPVTFSSIAAYLGIIQAGMVAVSIADSFAAPEVSNRLRIADAKAVISYQHLSRSGKQFDLGARIEQATDLPIYFVDSKNASWNESLARQSDEFDAVVCDPLDPVNILFSSGTTGDPKAIPWNHTTPIKCAVDGHLHHDLHHGDVVAWPTNLGWMMGPWLIFATLINRGTVAVYDDAPFGAGFGRFIQDAKVNMLGLVPSMVRLWRARRSMEKFDWSNIRCFSSTGEASSVGDMFYLSWLAGMRPIIEYCGGTEIGGGYISSTMIQNNSPATFSTPAFGLNVCILDENSNAVEEGELFLVPPSLGLSVELLNRDHEQTYFDGCPTDDSGRRLRRHGDHFKILSNGYFAAGGRTDDTMNLGGIKVSSIEIEKALNQLEEISETAAIAIPFEETGPDQLVVFYVLTEKAKKEVVDDKILLRKMNDAIRNNLNPLFKIRSIQAKDSLPRTASNKVMRRLLRDELMAE